MTNYGQPSHSHTPPTHHPLEVGALEPGQLFREQVDALPIRARHPREIRAPERPPRAERVDEPTDVRMEVAERVVLGRQGRHARRLDGDIRKLCERADLRQVVERIAILRGAVEPDVVDRELEPGCRSAMPRSASSDPGTSTMSGIP